MIFKSRFSKFHRIFRKAISSTPIQSAFAFCKYYFGGLYRKIGQDHIFLLSGGIAFSLFVCIVPFVLILFAILGRIIEASAIESQLDTAIQTMIPYQDYADYARTFVFSRIDEVIANQRIASIVGGTVLLFAASGLFSSLRTALNTVYEIKTTKPIAIEKLRDFTMVFLVLFLFLASTMFLPVLEFATEFADRFEFLQNFRFSAFQGVLITIFSFLLLFVMFFILYSALPYEKLGLKALTVSACWAALLWEIARQLFGYYITHFATLTKIYGAYIFVIVVAFWIYYSAIVLLLGAAIGQLYRQKAGQTEIPT